jgi:hypothetical protein
MVSNVSSFIQRLNQIRRGLAIIFDQQNLHGDAP